jgi:dihydroorotate dehydrogenase (NAD+) catalytic subunit
MLNSIGLPGAGIESFLSVELPKYARFGPPVIVSISGDTATQFGEMTALIDAAGVSAIELNISCPNIEADGQAFAMSTAATAGVVKAARSRTNLPLWAKLTPNTGIIAEIAVAAEAAGADALVVANTMLALAIDTDSREPMLGNVMGGLSGPAIKPIILRMVYQCSRRVSIPVIGCGGVSSGRDVVEYLLAGASAVQVGTESFLDPTALARIETELIEYCDERGIGSVAALVGAVRDENASAGSLDTDVAP